MTQSVGHSVPDLRQAKHVEKRCGSKRRTWERSFDDEEMCEFLAYYGGFLATQMTFLDFFHPGTFGGNSMQIDLSIFFRWVQPPN